MVGVNLSPHHDSSTHEGILVPACARHFSFLHFFPGNPSPLLHLCNGFWTPGYILLLLHFLAVSLGWSSLFFKLECWSQVQEHLSLAAPGTHSPHVQVLLLHFFVVSVGIHFRSAVKLGIAWARIALLKYYCIITILTSANLYFKKAGERQIYNFFAIETNVAMAPGNVFSFSNLFSFFTLGIVTSYKDSGLMRCGSSQNCMTQCFSWLGNRVLSISPKCLAISYLSRSTCSLFLREAVSLINLSLICPFICSQMLQQPSQQR